MKNVNPTSEKPVARITEWLGVDPDPYLIDAGLTSNAAQMPKSRRLQRAIMAPDTRLKQRYRQLVPHRLRTVIQTRILSPLLKANLGPFDYPRMRPATRESLAKAEVLFRTLSD